MNNLEIIVHSLNQAVISQRLHGGYLNATARCQAAETVWSHDREHKATKELWGTRWSHSDIHRGP